ncbi:hypothetical protein IAE37_005454 [Pseudomonas sp. S31]|uniref:DUF7079 family protein n=1 Tax=Pseudomonas sp. S31 TaxID=1564473 RepID=UPI001911CFEA|nr:hypothetical protein [Pseudomonas sp. S31]MBK5003178.1 hypothetical protein [Pseudomonas sp. S31]
MIAPRRLPIWRALSELFLDVELDDTQFAYVARIVAESGYSADEIQTILWNEVFPVLKANLHSVAGEWVGWPDDWLLQHLQVSQAPARVPRFGMAAEEISRCWAQVALRLPASFH